MTKPLDLPATPVERRLLLSRGAAVAGAAAGAVALGVAGARPAAATDGDALKQGSVYTGKTKTGLTVNSATEPALQVANSTGPALRVVPASGFLGDLQPGEVTAYPELGLVVGAEDAEGFVFSSPVATLDDVYVLPLVEPAAGRLANTRTADGRAGITVVSGPGYDSSYRLRGGTTIDVRVRPSSTDYTAAFVNLTATGSTAAGFLFAYSPAETTQPSGSTLNYTKGQTIANGTLAGVAAKGGYFYVRVFASSTTHVVVDLTGTVATQLPGPGAAARTSNRSAARRVTSRKAIRRR